MLQKFLPFGRTISIQWVELVGDLPKLLEQLAQNILQLFYPVCPDLRDTINHYNGFNTISLLGSLTNQITNKV